MKKISLAILALVAALAVVSCKSTGSTQDDVNNSFNKVYNAYASLIDLTDAETYTVQSGDTLTGITKKFYGNENGYYFPLIMVASREVVLDPDLISPGMELTVPNFEANVNNAAVAKKLSPYFKDIAGVYKQKNSDAAADIRTQLLSIADSLGK